MNGIKDADGKQVMRPLTNDEKDWLDKFYQGDLHASFNDNNKEMFELSDTDRNRCAELEKEIETVRKIIRNTAKNFANADKLRNLYDVRDSLRDELYTIDKVKGSYYRNNQRNNDLYGLMRTQYSSKLIPLADYIKQEDDEDEDIKVF